MLTGVYQWDREPVKDYIRRHGAEPPCDDSVSLLDGPLFLRLLPHMEVPGRIIAVQRARLWIDRDGTWTLLHYDFGAKEWTPCATGGWSEGEQFATFSVREVLGAEPVEGEPGELTPSRDRLLVPRRFAGSLFGLIGFRLVSPLPALPGATR